MKLVMICIAIVLAGCASTNTVTHNGARSDSRSVTTAGPLDELRWLAGSWLSERDGIRSEEHWTAPHGRTMLGMNRMSNDERTLFFEHLRIEVAEHGEVLYLASPKGRFPPTQFVLIDSGVDFAIFENPNHDFPQRITYMRTSNDTLEASVSGIVDGERREERWSWRRGAPGE